MRNLLTVVCSLGFIVACSRFEREAGSRTSEVEAPIEGIAVEVDMGPGRTAVMAFHHLEQNVPAILGSDWTVRPHGSHRIGFLLVPPGPLSAAEAEAALGRVRQGLGGENLLSAEIALQGRRASFDKCVTRGAADLPEYAGLTTCDPEWHLKFTETFAAWEKLRLEKGRAPGEGVLIGHVDTGLLPHPEIRSGDEFVPSILWSLSRNFVEKEVEQAVDAFVVDGNKPVPSHGTATTSVLVSPRGRQQEGDPALGYVTGMAPAARLLPIRATTSAVLMGLEQMADIANGVGVARRNGAKIISLSMGGRPDPFLHAAIKNAVDDGLIVIVAGGAHSDVQPWPASYKETIVATAGSIECKPWDAATPGNAIDITVPGMDIWHATTFRRAQGELLWAIRRGVGTSFAAPILAGAAAIWLSYHGWDTLVARYGKANVSKVFRQVLASEGGHRDCAGIEPGKHGTGYLDVLKLLSAPLPEAVK